VDEANAPYDGNCFGSDFKMLKNMKVVKSPIRRKRNRERPINAADYIEAHTQAQAKQSRNHAGASRDSRSWIAIHSYVGPDVGSQENGIAANVALN
jgi:hypothetical protein